MNQELVIDKAEQLNSSNGSLKTAEVGDMLVSIITASYNSQRYIAETIRSVQQQTFTNWEMIIVDDCSTDSSIKIIESFLSDSRIKLLRHSKNKGIVAARNHAISHAEGNIIALLDSDDLWMPNKLAKQVEIYKHRPDIAIVYADYEYIDEYGRNLHKTIKAPNRVSYADILKTCSIGCLTSTYNVNVVGKRYFVEHGHEDYILWLDILKNGHQAVNAGETLAKYRISRNSVSSNKLKAAKWQFSIYRNVEKFNFFKAIYYFSWYACKGLQKHLY